MVDFPFLSFLSEMLGISLRPFVYPVLGTEFLRDGMGLSPIAAGLALTPFVICSMLVIGGSLANHVELRKRALHGQELGFYGYLAAYAVGLALVLTANILLFLLLLCFNIWGDRLVPKPKQRVVVETVFVDGV